MSVIQNSNAAIYETESYVVKIVTEPESKGVMYGIVNKRFGVVEAFISQLARVIQLADQFEYELKHGLGALAEGIVRKAIAAAYSGEEAAEFPKTPKKGKSN